MATGKSQTFTEAFREIEAEAFRLGLLRPESVSKPANNDPKDVRSLDDVEASIKTLERNLLGEVRS